MYRILINLYFFLDVKNEISLDWEFINSTNRNECGGGKNVCFILKEPSHFLDQQRYFRIDLFGGRNFLAALANQSAATVGGGRYVLKQSCRSKLCLVNSKQETPRRSLFDFFLLNMMLPGG